MAYKKRFYKRRYYKRFKKGTYQRKFYKRRYKKSYRKALKRPEVHIYKENLTLNMYGTNHKNGALNLITPIGNVDANGYNQNDEVEFKLGDKKIEGKKIRLKYLYIKGYITFPSGSSWDDDITGKLYVFRRKRNLQGYTLNWSSLMDRPEDSVNMGDPTQWGYEQQREVLYMYDWKNDMINQVKRKVKNIYRKYDDSNTVIPFKIRIPLYDCVLSCDTRYDNTLNKYVAHNVPATNDMYFSALFAGQYSETSYPIVKLKYKIYYTDY